MEVTGGSVTQSSLVVGISAGSLHEAEHLTVDRSESATVSG